MPRNIISAEPVWESAVELPNALLLCLKRTFLCIHTRWSQEWIILEFSESQGNMVRVTCQRKQGVISQSPHVSTGDERVLTASYGIKSKSRKVTMIDLTNQRSSIWRAKSMVDLISIYIESRIFYTRAIHTCKLPPPLSGFKSKWTMSRGFEYETFEMHEKE